MSNHEGPTDDHKEPFEGRTYLYIRDHPADDGSEPLPSTLPSWLSPDIIIVQPNGVAGGEAIAEELNQVQVTVTNRGGITAIDAYVDAFVANPSTGFTPATAALIGGDYLTVAGYSTALISFPWTPSASEAGHRCLLARVSQIIPPDTYTNNAIFDVRGDRHISQRNIHIVSLEPAMRMLSFRFEVVNPIPAEREFIVQATEVRIGRNIDLVRAAIGCGFAQFGETPLEDIRLQIDEMRRPSDDDQLDRSERLGLLARPLSIERTARRPIRLDRDEKRIAILTVGRNPDTREGDLHVVQVAQLDAATKQFAGGLWVVVQH